MQILAHIAALQVCIVFVVVLYSFLNTAFTLPHTYTHHYTPNIVSYLITSIRTNTIIYKTNTNQRKITGNEKALATVTAIIDGMGSIGAALGPMLTGYISELPGGFDNVFIMLYAAALCAGLLLSGLVLRELGEMLGGGSKKDSTKGGVGGSGAGGLSGVVLAAEDVVNSASFRYIPPDGEDGMESSTIDNETGALLRGGGRN